MKLDRKAILAQAIVNLEKLQVVLDSKKYRMYRFLFKDNNCLTCEYKKLDLSILSDEKILEIDDRIVFLYRAIVTNNFWKFLCIVGKAKYLLKLLIEGSISIAKNTLNCKRDKSPYEQWLEYHDKILNNDAKIEEAVSLWISPPLISLVIFPGSLKISSYFRSFSSIRKQKYKVWDVKICLLKMQFLQICFWNIYGLFDRRIEIFLISSFSGENLSFLVEKSARSCRGLWVAFLEAGDLLNKNSLHHIAKCGMSNSDATIIYGDEGRISKSGIPEAPIFKHSWDPPLFYSYHYFGSLPFYRREALLLSAGSTSLYPGQFFYDLSARIIEKFDGHSVKHVPVICSHHIYRRHKKSPSKSNLNHNSRKRVIQDYFLRNKISARVSHSWCDNVNRVSFAPALPLPLVSILIPIRDKVGLLKVCLNSIFLKTTYPNFEVIVIDNGSIENETLFYLQSLTSLGVKVLRFDEPFNYSRLNNKAVESAGGDYICLLNNDIEIISENWIEEMLMYASQDWVGCVGAKLWYPDNRIQHAGVVLGIGGIAAHIYKLTNIGDAKKIRYLNVPKSVGAVTGACLMVNKAKFNQVGGLDESLAVAFNDVDFCIKLNQLGLKNIWTPYAELFHHESVSRGYEDTSEKKTPI